MSGSAKPEIGPVGHTVVENIKRLRLEQHLAYTELSARLADIGRNIPPLGLRRMLEFQRRIDVDELDALATVLGVSMESLLSTTSAQEYRSKVLKWLTAEDDHKHGRVRPRYHFMPDITGVTTFNGGVSV